MGYYSNMWICSSWKDVRQFVKFPKQSSISCTHSYSWVERCTLRVKKVSCTRTQHIDHRKIFNPDLFNKYHLWARCWHTKILLIRTGLRASPPLWLTIKTRRTMQIYEWFFSTSWNWIQWEQTYTNFKKLFAYMYLMKKMPLQHQVVDYHSVMLLMSTEQDQTQC